MAQPDILISEDLNAPALDALAQKYEVQREPALFKDAARLKQLIAGARAILVRNQTQITAAVLETAPRLMAIGRLGVGLDNIDVPAASRHGVVVIAPLEANATSVAELTLGLMLALARKLSFADRSTRAGGWDRPGCTGIELAGKALALVGFGRIGRLVAARAQAFGMRVIVYDPFLAADAPVLRELAVSKFDSLEKVLAQADFVSSHSPLTAETRHLFNARALAAFKPGAYFINTSRGGVVDESALIHALETGALAGAALDVREVEPPPNRTALEQMDNVILTPHIGAFTKEAQTRTFEAVAEDIGRVLQGEAAVNWVNFSTPRR